MADDEFRLSDNKEGKEPTKKKNTSTNSVIVGRSGVKEGRKVQQSLEEFPNKNTSTTMLHHHNRPFHNDDGPTSFTNHNNNINIVKTTTSAFPSVHTHGGALLTPLHPFHISSSAVSSTTLKSSGGRMAAAAASLGGLSLFTGAQWKELQRQTKIYKYIMDSIPVPPHLLIHSSYLDGVFNLRLSSCSNGSTDPEPGRCRRTDGKKWRCSRDVAPNHKYCERHMHRGSRKPVELQHPNNNQIKRPRHEDDSNNNNNHPIPLPILNPTTTKHHGSSSHFLQSSLSLDNNNNNFGVKATNFGNLASLSSNKQPRGLEGMLNGDPISLAHSDSGLGWQSLMHNKAAINTEPPPPQYLNSLALDQQDRNLPMFFNPSFVPMESLQSKKPRGFIDAWSNSESVENKNKSKNSSAASSIPGESSLSSLDLSMGGGPVNDEDMGNIGMGLGLVEPHDDYNTNHNDNDTTKISLSNWLNTAAPWVASSTPGGPLAEVLMPTTTVSVESSGGGGGPLGTMSSSPSGVLRKTFVSLSDSSGNSSPTVASSSRADFDEIALFKFNQM